MSPKFTQEQLHEFYTAYYNSRETNDMRHLRFGQAFFWFFRDQGMSQVTDPSLFYEVDEKKAYQKILDWYIE